MEIWLLVAIVTVGAAALYVAATFNKRTRQHTAPLADKTEAISRQIEGTGGGLKQQLDALTAELKQQRELTAQDSKGIRERLDHADRRISNVVGQLSAELEIIKHQCAQIGTWQDRFGGELRQQLDHQATQLGESLVQLSAQVAGIESYIKSEETQTTANLKSIEESIQDTGTRQSQARDALASITQKLDRQLEMNTRAEDHDHRAAQQMADTISQIRTVLHHQSVIESYLRASLDYEVMKTSHDHQCRIVTASVRLGGPGADLLWPLLLSFCETAMRKAVPPESPPVADSRSYLLWQSSDGRQLEEVLRAKLTACQNSPESPDPGQRDGLEELRSLVMALHIGGPGTVQVGPLIINRTPRALLGCVVTATEAMQFCHAATPMSPDTCEEALGKLAQGRVIELTSWADSVAL